MEMRRVRAADIVHECGSAGNHRAFDKGVFKEVIFDLPLQSFNEFCIDVLRLEYHHHVSVGKWCTESPFQFRNGELNFYQISYDVDPAQLINTPNHELVQRSRIFPYLFSKQLLLRELTGITDGDFNCFCRNIKSLHLHKLLVECFYFTDDPEEVRSKLMLNDDNHDILFQLQGINRATSAPQASANLEL